MSKIGYIYHSNLRTHLDKLPNMKYRATIVQELINSYNLINGQEDKVRVIQSIDATDDELKLFHTADYIEIIKKCSNTLEEKKYEKELETFGLMYDCPMLTDMYGFITSVAGSSLTAAKALVSGNFNVVINWFGGWHHAQSIEAEGFCYINDIVLAIHKLQEKFDKVLYIDLDVHHGNGVQNAFEASNKVVTLSIHKVSPGFYPGTGLIEDIGIGTGKYYTINVPLNEGVSNRTYEILFNAVFERAFNSFKPNAMVVQCGGDILKDDPIGQSNVTLESMGKCVKRILECNLPVIFLGGGGYNFSNTARYWAYLTSLITNQPIDDDIPDNCQFFTLYKPTYELQIYPGNMKDENTEEYISAVIAKINTICDNIQ